MGYGSHRVQDSVLGSQEGFLINLHHFSHLVFFFYSHCSSAFVLLILSCPLALLWGRVGLRQANVEGVPLPGQQGLIAE